MKIAFQHDVEAFGDKPVNLRKTPKPGELPKAAMGTAECVYWDENRYSYKKDNVNAAFI